MNDQKQYDILSWSGLGLHTAFQVSGQFTAYMAHPIETTVAPHPPEELPALKYCPSATILGEQLAVDLHPDVVDRNAWAAIDRGMKAKMKWKYQLNSRAIFLDSLIPHGQCFWTGRFSNFRNQVSQMHTGEIKLNEAVGNVYPMLVDLFDTYMARTNSTFEMLLRKHSIVAKDIIEATDNVQVTKEIGIRGVCFLITQREPSSRSARFRSYTISLKKQDDANFPPMETISLGHNAIADSIRGVQYVTFPADYLITVTPNTYRKVHNSRQPCSTKSHQEQEFCVYQKTFFDAIAIAARKSDEKPCKWPIFDKFLPDGRQYSWSDKETSVKDLCSYFLPQKHSFLRAVGGVGAVGKVYQELKKSTFSTCPPPCVHTGYQMRMTITRRSGNRSSITVNFLDPDAGRSYTQEYSFSLIQLVSEVGGTLGVWVGGSFVAILHAMYYGLVYVESIRKKLKAVRRRLTRRVRGGIRGQ